MRRIRLLPIALLIGILSSFMLPMLMAVAATETTVSSETTVAEQSTPTKAPAVSIVDEPAPEELQPWTIRYLIPTSIVLAGVLVFGTVVQYFVKVVRTRYKTVE